MIQRPARPWVLCRLVACVQAVLALWGGLVGLLTHGVARRSSRWTLAQLRSTKANVFAKLLPSLAADAADAAALERAAARLGGSARRGAVGDVLTMN